MDIWIGSAESERDGWEEEEMKDEGLGATQSEGNERRKVRGAANQGKAEERPTNRKRREERMTNQRGKKGGKGRKREGEKLSPFPLTRDLFSTTRLPAMILMFSEPSALKLVMVQGPRKGETLEFVPGSKVRIARVVRGNNLPIKDSGISFKHLSIESESGKWVLRYLDSSNRTVLNGLDIPPNTPVDLTDGNEIKIGEYTFIEVRIARYEESRLRWNPRRRVNIEKIEVVGKRGRGRPPRARVLKTEVMEDKPVEENLAQQVDTRKTRSSKIEELGKIPGTAGTSTVSDAGGRDGLHSIPQPSYQSG
ncbi:FHA domain-containing protein At4g14490-like [Pyrus communis]|uniref:FHA domain-containing protein At4g14490-like n=1 Tax=Pyrus communis TaxID=23211 RepID=UPI0035C19735